MSAIDVFEEQWTDFKNTRLFQMKSGMIRHSSGRLYNEKQIEFSSNRNKKPIYAMRIPAIVKTLNGIDPLLYAAKLAIGPKQLTEAETRNTARRAFQSNPRLTSAEIGKAIGRSRQAVDSYIADLRATSLLALDLKIFRLNLLGMPQDRIAKRLDTPQQTISRYLPEMPTLAKWVNSDLRVTSGLSKGFTVPQVAQKHGWTEPMV